MRNQHLALTIVLFILGAVCLVAFGYIARDFVDAIPRPDMAVSK